MTLEKLRAHTGGQPRSRRGRTRGVGAKLTLSRGARVQLLSARLSFTVRGKTRRARLHTGQLTTGKQAKLRLALPVRFARRLALGTRVTLVLRLRARSTGSGCAFGKPRTLKVRSSVIGVARRTAL